MVKLQHLPRPGSAELPTWQKTKSPWVSSVRPGHSTVLLLSPRQLVSLLAAPPPLASVGKSSGRIYAPQPEPEQTQLSDSARLSGAQAVRRVPLSMTDSLSLHRLIHSAAGVATVPSRWGHGAAGALPGAGKVGQGAGSTLALDAVGSQTGIAPLPLIWQAGISPELVRPVPPGKGTPCNARCGEKSKCCHATF